MKAATLLLLVAVAFATVQARPQRSNIIMSLSRAFKIGTQDVERCLNKSKAEMDDFDAIEGTINDESLEGNENAVKRASCAMVCCAHIQGTMIGGKVNVPFIQKLISESKMPEYERSVLIPVIHRCNDAVKNIEDQCDLGYAFLKCMIESTKHLGL